MLTLLQKQKVFAGVLVPRLLLHVGEIGLECTLGEATRTDEAEAASVKAGTSLTKSPLHKLRLAFDLMLFRGTTWLTDAKDYQALGEFWEGHSVDEYECVWGGRFRKRLESGLIVASPDAFHFSIAHGGFR